MKQQTMELYVAGKLGAAEAEAFEEYCLENPEVARQVEYEQRLRSGVSQLARGSTAEFVRADHGLRWQLAAAAGVLVAVLGGLFAWTRMPDAHAPALAAAGGLDSHHTASMRLAMVRGAEQVPSLPDGTVKVEIVGLFERGSGYDIGLDRIEARRQVVRIATLEDQRPTSPVTLQMLIDSDLLVPGAYSLQVRKHASDEEPLDFGFVKF